MDRSIELRRDMPHRESDQAPRSTHDPVMLDRIPCDVCQHQVPLSEALVPEAMDYVVYFCGLDCYERWRSQRDAQ